MYRFPKRPDEELTVSTIWNLVVVGFIYTMIDCGMGLHANVVEPDKIVLMAKYLLVAEILYVWNLVWTKISVLMMYYRIFRFPYFKKWAYVIVCLIFMVRSPSDLF